MWQWKGDNYEVSSFRQTGCLAPLKTFELYIGDEMVSTRTKGTTTDICMFPHLHTRKPTRSTVRMIGLALDDPDHWQSVNATKSARNAVFCETTLRPFKFVDVGNASYFTCVPASSTYVWQN